MLRSLLRLYEGIVRARLQRAALRWRLAARCAAAAAAAAALCAARDADAKALSARAEREAAAALEKERRARVEAGVQHKAAMAATSAELRQSRKAAAAARAELDASVAARGELEHGAAEREAAAASRQAALQEQLELSELEQDLSRQQHAMRRTMTRWLNAQVLQAWRIWREWKGAQELSSLLSQHEQQLAAMAEAHARQGQRRRMLAFAHRWLSKSLNAAFRRWRGAGERDHRLASFVKRWLSAKLDAAFRFWRVRSMALRREEAEQKAELLGEQLHEQQALHGRGVMSRWLTRWVQRDLLAAFVKWQRRGEAQATSRRVMLRWLSRYLLQAWLTWRRYAQAWELASLREEMEAKLAGLTSAHVEQQQVRFVKPSACSRRGSSLLTGALSFFYQLATHSLLVSHVIIYLLLFVNQPNHQVRFVKRMLAARQLAAFRKWRGDGQRDERMVRTWKRIHQRQLARGWRAWSEWMHRAALSRLQGLHSRALSDMQILANQSLMRRVLRRLYNISEVLTY